MANITIKNLPAQLHRQLKALAAREHRSLNAEVIHRLHVSVGAAPADAEAILAATRRLRAKLTVWATDADLDRFKRQGRP